VNDEPLPAPNFPLQAAKRIHATCRSFESAWSGPTRPELGPFLAEMLGPERSWLFAELLALEVELRRGAGEHPTEAEYRLSFPSEVEREIIASAFRHCADCEGPAEPSPHPTELATKDAQAFAPRGIQNATQVRPQDRRVQSSSTTPSRPTIEGYEILDMLGRGGMGVVYKARDKGLKRLVALKVILAGADAGTEHLARFRSEAEMVARLQHPNIVQIFDVGNQDGNPYIAFEFIEGQTLAEFAVREPQPPLLPG
jgi:hypothetical protein